MGPEVPKKGTKRRRSTKRDGDLLLPEAPAKGIKRRRSTQGRSANGDSKAKIRRLLSTRDAGEESTVVPKRQTNQPGGTTDMTTTIAAPISAAGAKIGSILPGFQQSSNGRYVDNTGPPSLPNAVMPRRDSAVFNDARLPSGVLPTSSVLDTIEPHEDHETRPEVSPELLCNKRGSSLEHEIIKGISGEFSTTRDSDASFTVNTGGMPRKRPPGLTPSE